ncbi:MAG TPA: AAA family ATPase [bacterium]|nr:AAA family ATPase [bacterium]
MIEKIYLENLKGFEKEFLPIKDVNFFVGENSSGKTAVLNILNVLSRENNQGLKGIRFNNEDVEMGFFKEIVNINSNNESHPKTSNLNLRLS